MIRVLHVTEDHSAKNTGISAAVDAMTRCVPDGIRPSIACVGGETLPVHPGVHLYSFPTTGLAKAWRFSGGSTDMLVKAVEETDIVHLHGLWMWVQWAAARQAVRLKKPFVLTSHGMLEPWIWQRQSSLHRLKKYLYWRMIALPAFHQANIVHALTAQEVLTLTGYFPGKKPLLIPHGIDLTAADQYLSELPTPPPDQPPYFLFLGRLHPVKGIHLLLRAFARLPVNSFQIKLAGPTQPQEAAYAESLHHLITELDLGDRVAFTGVVNGQAKWQMYRDAWTLCLPSFSEVTGLVNLEAAAARTPVLTTFESGVIPEWDRQGGLLVHPDEESILNGLKQAITWSTFERQMRGQSLRNLVETQYGWDNIGKKWADVYCGLAGAAKHD
jgi:glycosyltransferase involved in cell wall biosynthesis